MFFARKSLELPTPEAALPGRPSPIPTAARHFVLGTPLAGPFPQGTEEIYLGLGCFWGAERKFWTLEGVFVTSVGYAAGYTANATYEEVCSGRTGHNEVVRVVFDPARLPIEKVLKTFWESHDPTQYMRQGNDIGTQYRTGIYWTSERQRIAAEQSRAAYQAALTAAGLGEIQTEIKAFDAFYHAEEYHQQYLAKNPGGYCGLGGTGVACPVGSGVAV
ncbi:MAG: peptide-methionine (S)-S-oxide reductase MsrA [Rhizobiales bacterium]|nr:peptide-methionine (S)-S-oxide reductase MsrA [Hyphomicrobiales bacterium]